MTDQFLGQIQPFGFGFAPKYWAQCNGQILPIQQNAALFSLLGVVYGGNGSTNFALPNLQSRVPMHQGSNAGTAYPVGLPAGEEQVALTSDQLPMHTHVFVGASTNATAAVPSQGAVLANVAQPGGGTPNPYYASDATPQPLNPGSVGLAGGNLPHSNLQPYLTINWCIALSGIFPSRN